MRCAVMTPTEWDTDVLISVVHEKVSGVGSVVLADSYRA